MDGRTADEAAPLLSEQPPSRAERRLAAAAVVASIAVFAAIAPFAGVQYPRFDFFLPVYQTALVMCDLITAILLFGHFSVARSRAILFLAAGYLFSAAMAVFHALSFPGLFAPYGLLGSGPQTTAWLYFLWHLGFPASVIAYAVTRDERPLPQPASGASLARPIVAACACAMALASLLVLVTTIGHDALPVIMHGDQDLPAKYHVAWLVWLFTFAALPLLWRRERLSLLDLWLMVVLSAWLCDVAQAAVFNFGRFSLGWYTGRIYGLFAASILLAVFIVEVFRLHARLAESVWLERRQRTLLEEKSAELNDVNRSLEQRVDQRTEQLRQTMLDLANAEERERRAISLDLHDDLAQVLTAARMKLALLPRGSAPTAAAIVEVEELCARAERSVRSLAFQISSPILYDLGLVSALESLADEMKTVYGLHVTVRDDGKPKTLAEPVLAILFRAARELVINVAKHAGTRNAEMSVEREGDLVALRIADAGVGFDVTEVERRGDGRHLGLRSVRERLAAVGGSFEIRTRPGDGTVAMLTAPLSVDAEGQE